MVPPFCVGTGSAEVAVISAPRFRPRLRFSGNVQWLEFIGTEGDETPSLAAWRDCDVTGNLVAFDRGVALDQAFSG